jgi:hypothetical protein
MPRRWFVVAAVLLAPSSGCGKDGTDARAAAAKPAAKADAAEKADTAGSEAAKTPAANEPQGRIVAGPLPIADMLGHAPAEVQAKLGDPLGKGEARESCVRYVPDRVWFRCQHAVQRYADPTGTFEAVGVEYEDGKASALAFDGMQVTGPFDPTAALRHVGLELPAPPKLSEPAAGTKVYAWFNSSARLLIHGRQYRVQVSVVEDDWQRAKVELVLNDPLSPDEQARKIE